MHWGELNILDLRSYVQTLSVRRASTKHEHATLPDLSAGAIVTTSIHLSTQGEANCGTKRTQLIRIWLCEACVIRCWLINFTELYINYTVSYRCFVLHLTTRYCWNIVFMCIMIIIEVENFQVKIYISCNY